MVGLGYLLELLRLSIAFFIRKGREVSISFRVKEMAAWLGSMKGYAHLNYFLQ